MGNLRYLSFILNKTYAVASTRGQNCVGVKDLTESTIVIKQDLILKYFQWSHCQPGKIVSTGGDHIGCIRKSAIAQTDF